MNVGPSILKSSTSLGLERLGFRAEGKGFENWGLHVVKDVEEGPQEEVVPDRNEDDRRDGRLGSWFGVWGFVFTIWGLKVRI